MLDLQGYGATIVAGSIITIEVALCAVALAKLSQSRLLRSLATAYTTLIRGVPDLVLMLLLYYGGQMLVNELAWRFDEFAAEQGWGVELGYLEISPFIAGVLVIGFIFGSYMAETFRGAILAVDKGQLEAARAFGMTPWQVFHRVLFPQMMRHALPGFGNNWLVLLKTTALVSVIGLDDMVRNASLGAGATQLPFNFYFAVALMFLLFTTVSTLLLQLAERKYSLHTR